MESTKPSQAGIAIKWAIFNLIVGVILTVLFQVMKADQNGPIRYVAFVPFIIFMIMAQNDYKKQNKGFMNYGEGFVEGLLFSVFAAILGAIFTFIYLQFINPQMLQDAFAAKRDQMVQQGLSSDQIDQAAAVVTKFGAIIGAVANLFVVAIIGTIIALITAAILKKEPTVSDIENQASTADPAV